MSWDGLLAWDKFGSELTEIQRLVGATSRQAGGRRSVPVHVRCAGGHDTGARVRLSFDESALVLESRHEIYISADGDVAEELSEIDPDSTPGVRMKCAACKDLGQGLAPHKLLALTEHALRLWAARGRQRERPPRFVWPHA